jgi:hypothetical protein
MLLLLFLHLLLLFVLSIGKGKDEKGGRSTIGMGARSSYGKG